MREAQDTGYPLKPEGLAATLTIGSVGAELFGMAVDAAGSVQLSGLVEEGPASYLGTIRYGPEGTLRWLVRHPAFEGGEGAGASQVLDPQGNVFLTALSRTGAATVLLDPDGKQLWLERHFSGLSRPLHRIFSGLDPGGDFFVAGTIDDPGTRGDFVASKYTPLAAGR